MTAIGLHCNQLRLRRLALINLIIVALVMGFCMAPRHAHAQTEQPGIEFSDLVITKKTANSEPDGVERPKQLRQYDQLSLFFNWRAAQGVVENNFFTLQLPQQFGFVNDFSFPLADTSKTEGGTCSITAATKILTCTFNDKFVTKSNVHGTVRVDLESQAAGQVNQLPFTFSGNRIINYDVPGGEIGHKQVTLNTLNKFGWYSDGKEAATWQIAFFGAWLADSPHSPAVFTDEFELSSKYVEHTLNTQKKISVQEFNTVPGSADTYVYPAIRELKAENVRVDPSNPLKFSFSVPAPPGGWSADKAYEIFYETKPATADRVFIGAQTKNTVKTNFRAMQQEYTLEYQASGSGTITGLNSGTFEIRKLITPESQGVGAGTAFTVRATWNGGQEDVEVRLNGPVAKGTVQVPEGTEITLSEINFPNMNGITFGDPVFSATNPADLQNGNVRITNGGKTAVIRTNSQGNVGVTVTNTTVDAAPFSVVKRASGIDGVENHNFEFSYLCNDPNRSQGTITAKGNGQPVKSDKKFPIGTECTVTEVAAAAEISGKRPTVTPATGVQTVRITKPAANNQVATAEFNNVYAKDKGRFEVRKVVEGLAPADVDAARNKTFHFTYQCNDPAKTTGVIEVKGDGVAKANDKDIEVGSQCTVTEDTARAGIDNYALGNIQPKTVAIAALNLPRVVAEFTNTYSKDKATFRVQKNLTGVAGEQQAEARNRSFKFTYTCGAETGELLVPGDGTWISPLVAGTQEVKKFDVGTSCTITEQPDNTAIDNHDWTPTAAQTKVIAAKDQPVVSFGFTNAYTQHRAKFKVRKQLAGNIAAADEATIKAKQFQFTYECSDGTNGSLTVTGDKEAESLEDFPIGTSCTITETEASANADGYDVAIPKPQVIEIKPRTETTVVEFTNTYTRHTGGFKVVKTVVAKEGAQVPENKTFDFDYTCTKGDEKLTGEITGVTVAEGKTVTGIPVGMSCSVVERDAKIDLMDLTVAVGDPVTIAKDTTGEIAVTNTYTQWVGTITVNKELVGSEAAVAAARNHTYRVGYVCTKGQEQTTGELKITPDTPATLEKIPAGSSCVFTETPDSVAVVGLQFNPAESVTTGTETIKANNDAKTITITNAYSELGRISIRKVLGGLNAPLVAADRKFRVQATWQLAGVNHNQEFDIKAGQTYAELPPLPVGTQVTLKEIKPEDDAILRWDAPIFSSSTPDSLKLNDDGSAVVTITPNSFTQVLDVELRNNSNPPFWWGLIPLVPLLVTPLISMLVKTVTKTTPKPQPPAPQPPKKGIAKQGVAKQKAKAAETQPKQLAKTGASVQWFIAFAALISALGALLMHTHRRRNR
ncbi:hypothetical protein CMUST_00900 [Corynebacterium mustelae]|uniref:Uncharacterized protein n=1 Tax=Corynebacterium mustelae TaxID=571915 RepID=A0A0G3GTM5_9CORY|nr:DUF5979 domain-containing protein [Corynebacterium mustelae]AKK04531.1 hypothetical protein CMUST_00900 [Corynebacterium mustelae]